MSDLDEFKSTYFDECSELLTELEEQFVGIEDGDHSADRLNAVFRAIHSIKGGAGAFGFTGLVAFAHAYETLLDKVRDGDISLSEDVVSLCIRSNDLVTDFVEAARNGDELPEDHGAEEKARFDALCSDETAEKPAGDGGEVADQDLGFEFTPVKAAVPGASDGEPADDGVQGNIDPDLGFEFTPMKAAVPTEADEDDDAFDQPPMASEDAETAGNAESGLWQILFAPHSELFARANDPLLLFAEIATLGEVEVTANLGAIPPLADFEPFGVYCAWTLVLNSPTATEADIREVFEFVDGNCELAITRLTGDKAKTEVAGMAEADDTSGSGEPSFSDLMDESGPVAEQPPTETNRESPGFEDLLNTPEPVPEHSGTAAEVEAEAETKPAVESEPAPAKPSGPQTQPAAQETERRQGIQSIRVDLEKVDRVVNMVGELVITQSMLTQQMDEALRAQYQELVRGLEVLAQTTRGLQDSVMAIRAQPVKSVFSRMPRLVRELEQKTGKKIRLETVGEATEIDKTVIEQLSDPLTHMIRNSADHGIEAPETRLAAGKAETGVIRLSAEQSGGSILIVVEDDGQGINRERVLSIARERGVIESDAQLTDEQVDQLVFAPGFSTAETVSNISGRGVGMDVVLSNIKRIGGSVNVRSTPGKGTRMTLRLPLTLAVLDVMLVQVAANPYVVPLSSIVETIQCSRANFERMPSGGTVLQVRGEYVKVIDLAERFALDEDGAEQKRDFVVLCETEGSVKLALLVDDIIGQQQVVIKSLEENFDSIDGIAGGTILGDGNVALIVDVAALSTDKVHRSAA